MKFLLSLALLCATATTVLAQTILSDTVNVFSGTLEVSVVATCRDSAGNFYETASSGIDGSASGSCVTEKLSPTGAVVWTNTFSMPPNAECFPYAVIAGKTGDAFVLGTLRQDIAYTQSPILIHISGGGSTLWSVVQSASNVYPEGLAEDASGNPIIAITNGSGFNLIKYNEATSAAMFTVPVNIPLAGTQGFSFSNLLWGGSSGYLYAFEQTSTAPPTYSVVRYNETNGAVIWSKPLTANGSLTNLSPAYGTILASGDLLVAGSGAPGSNAFSVATLDRMAAATGDDTYRQIIGPQTAGITTSFNAAPVTDNFNQAYWSVGELNGSTFATTDFLGKTSVSGLTDWMTDAPSDYDWNLAPAVTGGLFAASDDSGGENYIELSSTGKVLWNTTTAASPGLYAGAVYVDGSDNLHVGGPRTDPNFNQCFGLLTLSGVNHAALLNRYYSPSGDEDNRFLIAANDLVGNTYAFESRNNSLYLIKLSELGTVLWRTPIEPALQSKTPVGVRYSSLGFVAAALNTSTGAEILKLNASTGALVWASPLVLSSATNSYSPVSVQVDPAGNIDLGTSVSGPSLNTIGVQVDQFGPTGTHTWTYSLPADGGDGVLGLDGKGNLYVGGYVQSPGEFVLAKLTEAGALTFKKTFPQAVVKGLTPVCHLTCDPTTGNTFLAVADYYKGSSLTNSQTAVDLQAIDTNGNLRWKQTLPMVSYWGAEAFDGRVVGGDLYLRILIPQQHTLDLVTMIEKLDGTTGGLLWSNVHLSDLATKGEVEEFANWDFDPYGNPVVAGESIVLNKYVGLYDYVPGEAFVYKVDRNTGHQRWITESQGTHTSPYNHFDSFTIPPTDQPLLLGQTPSATGPGSVNELLIRLGSPPYCNADAYKCLENQALPSTAASVLANDEDVTGATCTVLSQPKHAASFSLSASGKITYTPVAGFSGTDTFTYTAKTALGTGNTATVTITVSAN